MATANQLAYMANKEAARHNQAMEQETARSNVTREQETYRHNTVSERETNRSNLAQEKQAYLNYNENVRHAYATESETRRSNLAKEAENERSNTAREREMYRHNRMSERQNAAHWSNQDKIGNYSAYTQRLDAKNRFRDSERSWLKYVLTGLDNEFWDTQVKQSQWTKNMVDAYVMPFTKIFSSIPGAEK